MHRCLCIPEILEPIFNAVFYRTPYGFCLDTRSLLALLTTCQFFKVPAMRLRWRSLYDLTPLIMTLPEDLVKVNIPEDGARRTVTFRRDVQPGDWDRFDFYAQFVRELGITWSSGVDYEDYDVDKEVYRQLKKRQCDLLPNLRKLGTDSKTLNHSGYLRCARLLFASSTRHLMLRMDPSYVLPLCRLAVDIAARAPSLKYLELLEDPAWKPSDQARFGPYLTALLEAVDLEEYQCNWLQSTDKMLEALLRMPSLRKIGIAMDVPALARVVHLSPISEAPSRLTEITIWSNVVALSHLARMLPSLQPSSLQALSIYPLEEAEVCSQRQLNEFISAAVEHCSPQSLSCISFTGWNVRHLAMAATIDLTMLKPLFAFWNLRILSLGPYFLDVTDAEIKDFAMAWPLLEELESSQLLDVGRTRIVPRTTIRCLLWFAIYCPNLRSLWFNFNGLGTFASEGELAMAVAARSRLSCLAIGSSVIDDSDAQKVFEFLTLVFRDIGFVLMIPEAMDDDNRRVWEDVNARMREYMDYRDLLNCRMRVCM